MITKKKIVPALVTRIIFFQSDGVKIDDQIKSNGICFRWLEFGRKFTTIHMASSGYFQNQRLMKKEKSVSIDVKKLNSVGVIESHILIT